MCTTFVMDKEYICTLYDIGPSQYMVTFVILISVTYYYQ